MPTGYTAKLAEGPQSFEEFVWTCARAFGALVTMREDSLDAAIPPAFEPNPWNQTRLAEARAELARVQALDHDAAAAEQLAEHRAAMEHREDYVARLVEQNNRYNEMLAKVIQWSPPTAEHQGLKDFMADQIRISRSDYQPPVPELKPVPVWKVERIARIQADIAYHEKEYAEEVRRTEERNAWLASLRASVPYPCQREVHGEELNPCTDSGGVSAFDALKNAWEEFQGDFLGAADHDGQHGGAWIITDYAMKCEYCHFSFLMDKK